MSDDTSYGEIFVRITAGAGGREARDWAEILRDMYRSWGGQGGRRVAWFEETPSTDGGILGAGLQIIGARASLLRGEDGIHRLVRVSPYDEQARRHTSFARVEADRRSDAFSRGSGRRGMDRRGGLPSFSSGPLKGQIRSYVLHPYEMVKDLRTALEMPDVGAVLAGNIDPLLDSYAALN